MNFEVLFTLFTLAALEIILGIDNLVVITLSANHLPEKQQALARRIGLALALFTRIGLLSFAFLLVGLTQPFFTVMGIPVSVRQLVLGLGGVFLIYKGIQELIHYFREHKQPEKAIGYKTTLSRVITQIVLMDILFSIDSVITAVGIAKQFWVMATAILIAIIVMVYASDILSHLLKKFPRVRVLAFMFVIYIGIILMLEGCNIPVAHAYLLLGLVLSFLAERLIFMLF